MKIRYYRYKDRYQFQPFYIKAWRRIRHRPVWVYYLVKTYVKWLLRGAPGGLFEGWVIWDTAQGEFDLMIGHIHTMGELRDH